MTPLDKPDFSGPRRRAGRAAWLLLAPMLAWLAIFVVVPNVVLLIYSFGTKAGFAQVSATPSINGYLQVFAEGPLRALWRSVLFAVLTTAICLIAGYPVAWFIGRARASIRNTLLLLVMIPFWTSFLIRTYAWIIILRKEGLLNGLIQSMGLINEPIKFLGEPSAELIGLVYSFLPFMILPIYGSVEKLDNALVEAALDLGAGPVRAFNSVIVPLTRPGIVAGVLLVFIPAVGMFAITDVLGGSRRPMIGKVIEQQFVGRGGDWPQGAAIGVVLLVFFVISYWLLSLRKPALS